MNPETENLFAEVRTLHIANVANAQKTAGNVVKIGVLLFQIKETVGHGKFESAMEHHAKDISPQCCRNYMRLARGRLIEEKARLLIKNTTVVDLPAEGKNTTVVDLAPALPSNAIPTDLYDQASKEVDETPRVWLTLPKKLEDSIVKNIRGKDLMDLYRDYGIVRAKDLKVYHPPKQLTPDEKIAAENEQAEELLRGAERALAIIEMDLTGKTGILAARIRPARWKEFLRRAVTVTKAARPLAKRKASPADKKAKAQQQVILRARWAAAKDRAADQLCCKCGKLAVLASCAACGGKYCIDCTSNHECKKPEPKPFGWEVRVRFNPHSGKPDETFHWVCSKGTARTKGLLKSHAKTILSIEPVTKEQWLRAYGDPATRRM